MFLRNFNSIIELILNYGSSAGLTQSGTRKQSDRLPSSVIIDRCLPLSYAMATVIELPAFAPLVNYIFGSNPCPEVINNQSPYGD